MRYEPALRTVWGPGPVGDAVEASYQNRLLKFIENEESEPIQLFSEEAKARSTTGDWYGEHAGKWLVAASLAHRRTQSEEIATNIRQVVSFLAQAQEGDGYLGTYAPEAEARLTNGKANQVRTWDIWVHAWAILGLLKAADVPGVRCAKETAQRIGDLLVHTFPNGSVVELGNHQGLSSAVVIEPLAELTLATGNPAYAKMATEIVARMEERGLPILSGVDSQADISEVGTGKAYQLCWILVGLVSLFKATGEAKFLRAAEYWFTNIAEHHLTPLGGPWGGIAAHKEVFNPRGFFSPSGLTETCSTASWMALCRGLFQATGKPVYIEQFERSLHNALLGAMDENGRDWCYFTFPNGRRNNTYHWACCKSSGALALEEAALMAGTVSGNRRTINLWQSAEIEFPGGVKATVEITPTWSARIILHLAEQAEFELAIRIPSWGRLKDGQVDENGFYIQNRSWADGDQILVVLEAAHAVHPYTYSIDHHGQEIVRTDYACLSWGPYVYATGPIDGYRKEETLRLARLNPAGAFSLGEGASKCGLPVFELVQPGRAPIPFEPYFEAGGRHDSAWRATWMQVAWQ